MGPLGRVAGSIREESKEVILPGSLPEASHAPLPVPAGFARLRVRACPAHSAEPHAPKLTTPKAHFGFNLGDDYCLANYEQYAAYLAKLEKESDRIKVVNVGDTAEKRPQLMAVVTSPANHKKLDQYRDIARKLATAEGCRPKRPASSPSRGRQSSGSTAVCTPARCSAPSDGRDDLPAPERTDAETMRILDDVVILFVHANPDGMDLVRRLVHARQRDPKKRSLARAAAALPEVHRPRQQPRLLRQHAGRDEEHEPRDVSRVVPADRLQPPPDRPARHGAVLPAVPRSRSTTTSIRSSSAASTRSARR